jgi:hypothetical protein
VLLNQWTSRQHCETRPKSCYSGKHKGRSIGSAITAEARPPIKVLGWSQLRAQIHEVGQGCYPIIIINDGLLYLYRQSAVTEQTDTATVTKVVWQVAKPFISRGYPHAPDFQGIQVLESHEDFVYAVVSLLGWIFGLIFLLNGLGLLQNFQKPITGFLFIIMTLLLLPPIINKFEKDLNIKLTRNVRILILLACFLSIKIIDPFESAKLKEQQKYEMEQRRLKQKKAFQIMEEKQKQQEIEREKKRAEAELKKIEREKRRAERERKKSEELEKANKDIQVFKNALFGMLNKQNFKIVQDVYLDKDLLQQVIIVMKPIWHIRNKHLRKNDATVFWELWASINSPNDPDQARVKLVSIDKDHVGGSRVWGGSLIWVED